MIVIPAIDVRGGRCVRLYQGRADAETVYAADPVQVAARWQAEGATRLHLVDLDGAFHGSPQILDLLAAVADLGVPVEYGGGLRTLAHVEAALAAGARWVVLGTVAVTDPGLVAEACRRWPGRIMVALDAREGCVTTAGWEQDTALSAAAVGRRVKAAGVEEVIYTDIRRDGTLAGANVTATRALARETGLSVLASGGVSSLADLRRLKEAEPDGVCGAIVGKALYEGTLRLADALKEVS
ncbi:MAG TPA: 1-(5-phosphoribosyl)-5-[(5-phosphoribosylamino)methylideneamino]imidazole-4-carboxamide isomerase [Firmicutes bacterium]|nr:1-(5-phosphoribosyl)-5-[(5-phosphoribosylamino)methylideneamino]imidazole-4-carboxamide isomerase [Bacillota bacterium]